MIDHDDRAIRVAAALGRPDHPRALKSLVDAAADRNWVRATFPRGFEGPEPWFASALLMTVLDRVTVDTTDELLVDGLEQQFATIDYGPLGATYEWGLVLKWLFPDRWRPSSYLDIPPSEDLSNTQSRLLAALVRNDDPWNRARATQVLSSDR